MVKKRSILGMGMQMDMRMGMQMDMQMGMHF